MALRNQPYIPLYVRDFMMDEKLRECSAESVGVYIFFMCVLHQSEEYGTLELKEKYLNENNEICGFAKMLSKHLPFQIDVIDRSLRELIAEKVLILDEKKLIQKRMVKDAKNSEIRALSGSKGGKNKPNDKQNRKQTSSKKQAKHKQNTVIEIENEYENDIDSKDIDKREYEGEKKEVSELEKTIQEFIRHRKKIKHPMADDAIVKLRNKLDRIGSTEQEKIDILNESIINGWQGVFPLKNQQNQKIKPKGVIEHI